MKMWTVNVVTADERSEFFEVKADDCEVNDGSLVFTRRIEGAIVIVRAYAHGFWRSVLLSKE